MSISPVNVSFGYSNKLTQLYKQGKLPIEYDIYGSKLANDTFIKNNQPEYNQGTFEHIVPKSKGGTEKIGNSAICTYENNQLRGNQPFWEFADPVDVVKYLYNFIDFKCKGFNGNQYVRELVKTLREVE